MNRQKSSFNLIGAAVALLCQVALIATALARESDLVVPKGTLAHATVALEQNTGGKVLEIRLADQKGEPVFEAAVASNGGVLYMRIESVSDTVTQVKLRDLPPWLLNYKMEAYLRSIEKAQIPLADAIVKAEDNSDAAAIGAGVAKPLSGTNAVLAYFIETIKSGKRKTLAVDAKTGAFIADPDELYEPHTPVKLAQRLAPD
jgi:uncharacterized membrane protein YkoI